MKKEEVTFISSDANVTNPALNWLIERLNSDVDAECENAVIQLGETGNLQAVPYLFRLRRKTESPKLLKMATKALDDLGAIADLSPMDADGWFEQIKHSSPAFETLCEVIGDRFVGYAMIIGIQVSGLTIDQLSPANTVVEFRVGENGPTRTAALPEFRRQLVAWIVSDLPPNDRITLPLDVAQAQRLIGIRYILLAPLHGISLKQVILETGGDTPLAHVLITDVSEVEEELEIEILRSRLREEVRRELATARDEPFQLDLSLIDAVEEAAACEDWEEVIRLIGNWPGPVSLLLRTPAGGALDGPRRARVGAGLRLLATAYYKSGRTAWAEELYRLGLQFVSEGPEGAALFRALGFSMVEEKRYGEAIGPLRRALALGASPAEIGPPLGVCFLRQGRTVAAIAVLEEARLAGAVQLATLSALRQAYMRLGDISNNWRALHDDWTTAADLEHVIISEDLLDNDLDADEITSEVHEPMLPKKNRANEQY